MAIELRGVSKVYEVGGAPLRVLDDISITIPNGELCAVMGPSGSGKSTLMNVLGCLDKPTSGAYSFDGEDLSALDDDTLARIRNRKIGFIFQSYNLVKRTTALDNVQLPMLYAGVPPAERRQRAAAALRVLGLADRAHHMPNELSGGQQQRVAIARALVMRPALILADEPTGALDSRTSLELMAIFQRLNREMGITIAIVTHEPEIAAHTRRILRLHDGALSADEIVRRPKIAAEALRHRAPLRLPVRRPLALINAGA